MGLSSSQSDSALDPKFHAFLHKCLGFCFSMYSYLLIAHGVSLPHSHLLPDAPLSLSSHGCLCFSFVTLCQPSWNLHSVGHIMVTYKSYTIFSFLYIFTGLIAFLICWTPIIPQDICPSCSLPTDILQMSNAISSFLLTFIQTTHF